MPINLSELARSPGGVAFRLQARKLLLTFAQLVDKEELANHIRTVTGAQEAQVKIAHETGETGHQHTHCAVDVGKIFNSRDCRVFDFDGAHPNIQIPKTALHWERIVKYLDKDDTEVHGEIEVLAVKGPSEANLQMMEDCIQWVLHCDDRAQVLLPPQGDMRWFMMSKSNYFQTLYTWSGLKKTASSGFQNFAREKIAPESLGQRAYLVCGPPATGKTQWALSHFNKAVLVRHMDDLHNITCETDGVVFDDMSFKHMPSGAIIHMLDMDFDSPVHLRYNNARIPKGLPRIFTSNDDDIFIPTQYVSEDVQTAINRRYELISITEKLY